MVDKFDDLSELCTMIHWEHAEFISKLRSQFGHWKYKENEMIRNSDLIKVAHERVSGSYGHPFFTHPLPQAEILQLNVIFNNEVENLKNMENNYMTHSLFLKGHIQEQEDIFNSMKESLDYREDVQVALPTDENLLEIIKKFEHLLQTYEDMTKNMLLSYRSTHDLHHTSND